MAAVSAGVMKATSGKRQSIRRTLILLSFLLFPVTLNYFSPYLIVEGASKGVVNGSFVVFALLFLSSLFVGRLWCGWGCPGAGLQEALAAANGGRARGGRLDWIKWAMWVPWMVAIALAALSVGGYRSANFFYSIDSGVSVDEPGRYLMYYSVVGLFLVLSLAAGRRGGCHYICWMAPFMILGRKIRNAVGWPSLRLKADSATCGGCKTCSKGCPMSLDVNRMVQAGSMENAECILCGTCVDNCPKRAIAYSFSGGR